MKHTVVLLTILSLPLAAGDAEAATEYRLELKSPPGEYWWGGLSVDGNQMPYSGDTEFSRDLFANNAGNQAVPLLISSKGRYVWSEKPIAYTFKGGKLLVTSAHGKIDSGIAGKTLKETYLHVSKKYFQTDGKLPDPLLFTHPQYNTWIELMYDQNEKDILKYAQSIVDQGYPPGVLMIDDNWQENYGVWEFSARRFKDPKGMVRKLHKMGFKVMLWVCPFVTSDCATYRALAKQGLLLRDAGRRKNPVWSNTPNKPAIVRWWNGASALLDLSNPNTRRWFNAQLDRLVNDYGVDGFKLDAGDAHFYKSGVVSKNVTLPNEHTMHFARIGLKYPLNEYRASWKMAGRPLAQRLRDKRHRWEDVPLLIPGIISQGLMGYAFTCPDMIGGGEYGSFLQTATIDRELVVRSAQCSALMPMMQFSVAPWRILGKDEARICKDMAKLHLKMGKEILTLARESAKTGEPIVRSLEYEYPNSGYATIKDQFLLGDRIMVAPVLEKGARARKVVFPKGSWTGDDGSTVVGPKQIEIKAPLARLPWYRRK